MSAKATTRAQTTRSRAKTRTREKPKPAGVTKLRARAVGTPRLPQTQRARKHGREALSVLPAGPVAAFGMGELLIRAWAARQYAA